MNFAEWRPLVAVFFLACVSKKGIVATETCYQPLGCFTDDHPFETAPFLPQGRDVIDVTYSLFVRYQTRQPTCQPNANFKALNITGPHAQSYRMKVGRKWRQLLSATKPTKIIIHDYDDTASNAWVYAMVEKFLLREDCQVITTNWKSAAGPRGFYQAAANARLVGAEIAHLLKNIAENKSGFSFDSVHVVGHGIGAHIASYVGDILKIPEPDCEARREAAARDEVDESWWSLGSWWGSDEEGPVEECPKIPQIGHITGLDPASTWYSDVGTGARLDASDAIFVDIIHTDITMESASYFGNGISLSSGHVDIYPNGGYRQPGCETGKTGLEGLNYTESTGPLRSMNCNHLRSIVYYLSSMDSDSCPMISYPCTGWHSFLDGKCVSCTGEEDDSGGYSISGLLSYMGITQKERVDTSTCLKLGPDSLTFWNDHKRRAVDERTEPQNIKAYLRTNRVSPYCLKYLRVELRLAVPSSEGTLSFQFTDQTNQKTGVIDVGRVSNWGNTANPTYLVAVPSTFQTVSKMAIIWKLGVTTSWWPLGMGNGEETRREIRLPLHKVTISELPYNEITDFCSAHQRLRSGRESRYTPCHTVVAETDGEN